MKFFNLDLHVSVIEDVTTQLTALGHEVESHLLSGHNWALGRPRASRGTGDGADGKVGYGSIHLGTWEALFQDAPQLERVREWQRANPQLADFDGYIATYPPAFALLYDGFPGKIILDVPVRYDLCFTPNPDAWRWYNQRLGELTDAGQLLLVANSRYDAAYYEYFTGRPCRYLSSTCDYIDRLAPKWNGEGALVLGWGEHAGCREMQRRVPEVRFVRDAISGNYLHADVVRLAKAIVWIPYTTSIMSFFEHYWLGIPLFVPTPRFLMQLVKEGLALSTFSWHARPFDGSVLPRVGTDRPDPHALDGLRHWVDTFDFYNVDEFPGVSYFESWDDLRLILSAPALPHYLHTTSAAMLAHNELRRSRNLSTWREVLA